MELLYICDLKGEWLDFIHTFSQLLPGLVAGPLSGMSYVVLYIGDTSEAVKAVNIVTI